MHQLCQFSDFITTKRIVFGDGALSRLPEFVRSLGQRAFVVLGEPAMTQLGHTEKLEAILREGGIAYELSGVQGEPRVSAVDAIVARARAFKPDFVLAMGGGSALDCGKAVAGLTVNAGSVLEYLEGVGSGRTLETPALPCIAVPTTAGTGSEATKNSVITGDDGGFKKSLRSPYLLPAIALVDPELTHSCPLEITASCGYDALTQLIESFTSNHSGPITDALAVDGIRKAARALPRVSLNGQDAEARRDMALASLFGGICLANAGLGAVHGMASAIGALTTVPHGVACALGLPGVLESNYRHLMEESPQHPCLIKLRLACAIVVGNEEHPDPVPAACQTIRAALRSTKIPRLSAYGVTHDSLAAIVADSRGSSMKFNPVILRDDELHAILAEWL